MSVAQNPLSIKVDLPRDDAVLLTIEGELDIDTATELQHHLANQLRHGRRHFLLDVSAVPFMDSSGMNIILRTYQEVRRIPGGVYVIAPTAGRAAHTRSHRRQHHRGHGGQRGRGAGRRGFRSGRPASGRTHGEGIAVVDAPMSSATRCVPSACGAHT